MRDWIKYYEDLEIPEQVEEVKCEYRRIYREEPVP
jgi:hypothetical protein